MARQFKWESWDYDCDGDAYIIAKDQCPHLEDVPNFICENDYIHSDCKPEMIVEEGWCKFQVRTDWENGDGEPKGGYVVNKCQEPPKDSQGKKKTGWFPVWIVRQDEWYRRIES